MTEAQIRQIVQQEIQASKAGSRFGLNPTQRHTHNEIDSPPSFQPFAIYGGIVRSDGTPALLPKGWSSTYDSGGTDYTITHNLGIDTTLYIVSTSCLQSTNNGGGAVISPFSNSFTATFVGGTPGDMSLSKFATSFCFTLIIVPTRTTNAAINYSVI